MQTRLCFCTILSSAKDLHLALHSGTISGRDQRILWAAKDETQVKHMQHKCLPAILCSGPKLLIINTVCLQLSILQWAQPIKELSIFNT